MTDAQAKMVTVIDRRGEHLSFAADKWTESETGHLHVFSDSKRVASFPPGAHDGAFYPESLRMPGRAG